MKSAAVPTAHCSRQPWVCWLIFGAATLIQCKISEWQNDISCLQKLAAILLKKIYLTRLSSNCICIKGPRSQSCKVSTLSNWLTQKRKKNLLLFFQHYMSLNKHYKISLLSSLAFYHYRSRHKSIILSSKWTFHPMDFLHKENMQFWLLSHHLCYRYLMHWLSVFMADIGFGYGKKNKVIDRPGL